MPLDPWYFIAIAPALLLAMYAQWRIHANYAAAQQIPARLSGAAAARHILDSAGLQNVAIEETPGRLSDHYDPRDRVVRLSPEVFRSRSLAAVGIAAHEVGHAMQHAQHYAPLVIRNLAVPLANFGSGIGIWMAIIGAILNREPIVWVGIALFSCVVIFQVVNLPVEFNASTRAKAQLAQLNIVDRSEAVYVNRVLNAAALTYVAATLQAVLTLLYLMMRFTGNRRS